ncbi:hypothetical protein N0B51_03890 [Tsuneonella sp. YG55]|uniref:Elongation factor P n=1 Tax=Tsuneonella litorea TaxID=2976475 RepID=A0A9X2W1C5_9SPHN|nr:hypothetical protein [Tsuneonella litorea]MCT2558115.1 hypothetical protein [Tsuneonella litorea]
MVARHVLPILLALPLAAGAAHAEGRLGTLEPGRYLCELPGDAAGLASIPIQEAWFDIVNASSYAGAEGRGTYLLTGKTVVFTRGPMQGMKFVRSGARTLKAVGLAGDLARMRCVRSGRGAAD